MDPPCRARRFPARERMTENAHRDSIFLEEAEVLDQEGHPAEQYLLRLRAPRCAQHARPGTFVHLRCDPRLPMRRPLSIMRASPRERWVELLYKAVGEGTRLLATRQSGERISMLGPIGCPFQAHPERPRTLLIGGGLGIPPMIFLADSLRSDRRFRPFALLGSEVPFPFRIRPSQHLVCGLPPQVIAAMPLLDDWGVPSRLTSLLGLPGCFEGYVTDLARKWLEGLNESARAEVEVFSCGPHPMLEATAALAREFNVPCQVSLEEFMACAVGGCAGCVVQVRTENGPAMRRVCVDGPVFDAYAVFDV
jgi:dihydroorotate dehydrogenase electron transfer subunit